MQSDSELRRANTFSGWYYQTKNIISFSQNDGWLYEFTFLLITICCIVIGSTTAQHDRIITSTRQPAPILSKRPVVLSLVT